MQRYDELLRVTRNFLRFSTQPRPTQVRCTIDNILEKTEHSALVRTVLGIDQTAGIGVVYPCGILENAQLSRARVLVAECWKRNCGAHLVDGLVALLAIVRQVIGGQEQNQMALRSLGLGELGKIAKAVFDFMHNVDNGTGLCADGLPALLVVIGEAEASKEYSIHGVAHDFRHEHVAGILVHCPQSEHSVDHLCTHRPTHKHESDPVQIMSTRCNRHFAVENGCAFDAREKASI